MRKLLLCLLQLFICSLITNAQQAPPGWLWLDGSGGTNYEYGCGIATDDSGFHYISGRFDGTISFQGVSSTISLVNSGYDVNPFVGKFDENGNCLWLSQQAYGWDYPRGFCTDKALKNNEYVTGNNNSGDGMFVYKFDNLGNVKWTSYLGTSSFYGYGGAPNGDGITADSSGDVYVVGETGDGAYTFGDSTLTCGTAGTTWPQDQEVFLTKMDKSGNFLWAVGAEGIDAANAGYDVGRDVVLDKSASYVFISGGFQDTCVFHSKYSSGDITVSAPSGTSSLFVAKYDTSGNLLFVATATNSGIPWINGFNSGVGATNALAVDSCGNVYVTGYYTGTAVYSSQLSLTASNTGGQPDGFVASCNSTGQWQWVDDIGSGSSTAGDYGQDIVLDKNNDVYVGGTINGTAAFGNGVTATASSATGSLFLAKYANSNGAVQWAQTSAGSSQSGVAGVAVDTQKFVYISGSFNGSLTLGSTTVNATTNEGNIFIAKLDTVPTLYIVPYVDSSYCPGSTDTIPYNVIGTFNSGNVFTAQLSDSTGSFVSAQNIGSLTSTTAGKIVITIPSNTPTGSTYLIRVISSNPATSSYVNGCGAYYQSNVYIDNFYVSIGGSINLVVTKDTAVCTGGSIQLSATGGSKYMWSNGDTTGVITVSPTTNTTYYVTGTKGSCISGKDSVTVGVNPFTVSTNPSSQTVCLGQTATLLASGGNIYNWSPSSGLNGSTGDSVIATPTADVTYTVTVSDSAGCSGVAYDTVTVVPPPNVPTISQNDDTLKSSASTDNQWYENGVPISGATGQDLVIGNSTDTFTVVVVNPADGCSSSSQPDITSGINVLSINSGQVSIYPNPTNGDLYINLNSSTADIGDWNLRLTDVLGQTIYTRNSLNYSNVIDLSNLAGGVYFITVTNKTGEGVFKVVKD